MSSMHPRMRAMVIRNLGLAPRGQGSVAVLKQVEDGVFNPATGEIEQAVTEYTGSGVRVNYSDHTHRNFGIPYSEYQIYLSPVQVTAVGEPELEMPTPQIDDTLVFLGNEVKVVELHPFNENGFGCGWKIRVRTS